MLAMYIYSCQLSKQGGEEKGGGGIARENLGTEAVPTINLRPCMCTLEGELHFS